MVENKALYLDEIHFEWFENKIIERYRDRELSHRGGKIPLMFDFFEPLKMDLVLVLRYLAFSNSGWYVLKRIRRWSSNHLNMAKT